MARMNEILTGRHNRFLQKHFSMKGEPPAPQLSSEIMPVHLFHSGAENRFLESWMRYGAFMNIATVVANVGALRIRNPSENVVAVIEKLILSDTVANNFQLSIGQTKVDLLSGTNVGTRLDGRQQTQSASNSVLILSFASNAPPLPAGMTQFNKVLVQANIDREYILDVNQELTLLPGDAYDFREQNTPGAEVLQACLLWRERQIEESERF